VVETPNQFSILVMYVFTPEYGVDTQCLSAYKKVKVSADNARPIQALY